MKTSYEPSGPHRFILYALIAAALPCFLLCPTCGAASTTATRFTHELEMELSPGAGSISVSDRITVENHFRPELVFSIARQARIQTVTVDGSGGRYIFRPGELIIFLDPAPESKSRMVTITFEAIFKDPLPSDPASFDNPGFGVEGTVSDRGAFLLAGSGWYPWAPGENFFQVTVTAPKGFYAVMPGEPAGHEDVGEKSISRWKVGGLAQGIALSAARYVIRSEDRHGVPVYTYFFPESEFLSETYITAASSHLASYEKLLGPYAFPKFAVVENFFPTGYGFPSYTLLGTPVLHLPFIPQTSLRHEIAHCWWGNGVLVDYEAGNWSEGLTTYLADYLSREEKSSAEAMSYRRQILRDYATLAAGKSEISLAEFVGRTDPATRAIGYGKSAFVFHMVRDRLGEEPFWNSLRRVYRERFQIKTSWEDFRKVFSKEGAWNDRESKRFFDQWIVRTGAPVLKLEKVRSRRSGSGWNISGLITQKTPAFQLDAKVRVAAQEGENIEKTFKIRGTSSPFSLRSETEPERVVLDPENDLFRLLYPEEVPPTVNSLKSSTDLVPVLCGEGGREARQSLELLLAGLNHSGVQILDEDEAAPEKIRGRDILFFGFPRSGRLQNLLPGEHAGMKISEEGFAMNGVFSSKDSDTLFTVMNDPRRNGKTTALFLFLKGTEPGSSESAARKITHYGQYSYLAFSQGINQAKGTWDITSSPLIHNFRKTGGGKANLPGRR
ncbi:MAG: M1 family aminopeptidase [Syntrophobacteraceae bacterium]